MCSIENLLWVLGLWFGFNDLIWTCIYTLKLFIAWHTLNEGENVVLWHFSRLWIDSLSPTMNCRNYELARLWTVSSMNFPHCELSPLWIGHYELSDIRTNMHKCNNIALHDDQLRLNNQVWSQMPSKHWLVGSGPFSWREMSYLPLNI